MKINNKTLKNTAFFYFHLERKKMPRFWAVFGHSVLFSNFSQNCSPAEFVDQKINPCRVVSHALIL
jgi:hypothetical protein